MARERQRGWLHCTYVREGEVFADQKEERQENKRRMRRPSTRHPGAPQTRKCHGDPAVDRAWLQVPPGIADREKKRVAGVIVEPVWIGTAALISNAIKPTGRAIYHYYVTGKTSTRRAGLRGFAQ